MNSEAIGLGNMVLLFVLPFFILIFLKKPIDRHFKKHRSTIRLIDLLVPYLMVGIHIFTLTLNETTWIPYILILTFVIGIALTIYIVYSRRELSYRRFFRVWWRMVFLIALLFFIGSGGCMLAAFII